MERNRRDNNRKKKHHYKKKTRNTVAKKCPHCGKNMKERGASNSSGGLSWKCRNKKCGRTVWEHKLPEKPPEAVVSMGVKIFNR